MVTAGSRDLYPHLSRDWDLEGLGVNEALEVTILAPLGLGLQDDFRDKPPLSSMATGLESRHYPQRETLRKHGSRNVR